MAQELATLKQPSPRSQFGAAAQRRTKAVNCREQNVKEKETWIGKRSFLFF
jgi:hypothetical protein